MRKVFLEDLPIHTEGNCKGKIDWSNCIGLNIPFEYEHYVGYMKVVSYKNPYVVVEYNGELFKRTTPDIIKAKIARIIGYTKQAPYKYNVNDEVENKRIINRYREKVGKDKISRKFYDCECLLCNEKLLRIEECNIYKNQYCYGCNNVEKTHPNIAKLIIGDCKKLTQNDKVVWKCPCCNQLNYSLLGDLIRREGSQGFPCKYCSDGFSYGEKILNNVMRQISDTYKSRKTFIWSDGKEYDGFDNGIFIEIHGEQHYKNGFSSVGGRTINEEQENDKLKELLAWKNNKDIIDYVVIRADKTDFDYIKNNIINSRLSKYYDLFCVDWDKVRKVVNNSSILCDVAMAYKQNNKINEISVKFNIHNSTVRRYLKRADEIGLCEYEPYKSNKKKVRCVNNGMVFSSVKEAAKWCGLKTSSGIEKCINKKPKHKTSGNHPITGERLRWERVI